MTDLKGYLGGLPWNELRKLAKAHAVSGRRKKSTIITQLIKCNIAPPPAAEQSITENTEQQPQDSPGEKKRKRTESSEGTESAFKRLRTATLGSDDAVVADGVTDQLPKYETPPKPAAPLPVSPTPESNTGAITPLNLHANQGWSTDKGKDRMTDQELLESNKSDARGVIAEMRHTLGSDDLVWDVVYEALYETIEDDSGKPRHIIPRTTRLKNDISRALRRHRATIGEWEMIAHLLLANVKVAIQMQKTEAPPSPSPPQDDHTADRQIAEALHQLGDVD